MLLILQSNSFKTSFLSFLYSSDYAGHCFFPRHLTCFFCCFKTIVFMKDSLILGHVSAFFTRILHVVALFVAMIVNAHAHRLRTFLSTTRRRVLIGTSTRFLLIHSIFNFVLVFTSKSAGFYRGEFIFREFITVVTYNEFKKYRNNTDRNYETHGRSESVCDQKMKSEFDGSSL